MNATQTTERQEAIEGWLKELNEAKKELDGARNDIALLDNPTGDPRWIRYYRLFMNLD